MTRAVIAALLLVSLTACSRSSFRVGEAVLCSTSDDDEPYFVCNVALGDLICIHTYTVVETEAWVCRKGCDDANDCALAGDVCCAGPTHGHTFGFTRGCVPRGQCETDEMPLVRDNSRPRTDSAQPVTPRDASLRDATVIPPAGDTMMSTMDVMTVDVMSPADAADAARD